MYTNVSVISYNDHLKQRLIVTFLFIVSANSLCARECHLPTEWKSLCPILTTRVEQTIPKMKLNEAQARNLENYLQTVHFNFKPLNALQNVMPKTTIELLIATYNRGLSKSEADKIAAYLLQEVNHFKFKNLPAFDNNTSHIIGREWHEIDYVGEGMTWQKQQQKYAPYGITDFKSLNNLKKFFPVESKLPYFNKIYQPMQE